MQLEILKCVLLNCWGCKWHHPRIQSPGPSFCNNYYPMDISIHKYYHYTYQKINRFDNIKKNFIFAIFDSFRTPGDSIGHSHWRLWSNLQFVTLLCNIPVTRSKNVTSSILYPVLLRHLTTVDHFNTTICCYTVTQDTFSNSTIYQLLLAAHLSVVIKWKCADF